MKAKLYNSVLLFTGLLWVSATFANEEPKVEKKKTYTKSYALGSSDKISLNNQFGEMKLTTWDKNEIKVDVNITAKADDEKRAQEILDRITISDGKDGNVVYFKTKLDNDKNERVKERNTKTHRNEGMEINYAVYLPAGNSLTAENQFGPMIIPDYRGEAVLESKFGSLTAGRISNAKSVTVEFGKADIAQVNGGKLIIKFSKGTVNKMTGDVDANFEFCDKIKVNVDTDIKDLDIRNSYSTVYLDLSKNLSANFDITTNFGEFSNKSNFTIKQQGEDDDRHGPKFTHKYTGTAGSGSTKFRVRSEFGKVILGHDLQVDMTEKSKNKAKTRSI